MNLLYIIIIEYTHTRDNNGACDSMPDKPTTSQQICQIKFTGKQQLMNNGKQQ